MEESQKQAMIDAYKKRLLSQANGMDESVLIQMCLTAFRHGVENTLAEVEPKQQKLKKQKAITQLRLKVDTDESLLLQSQWRLLKLMLSKL